MLPEDLLLSKPRGLRWLWGMRMAASMSILLPGVGMVLPPRSASWQDFVFLLLPMSLPYVRILWGTRTKARTSGLALAVATGVGSLGLVLLVLHVGFVETSTGKALAVVFALTQAGLAVTAIKSYRMMKDETTDTRTFARGLAVFSLYLFIFLVSISLQSLIGHSRKASPEASAVGSLRTIITAETTYASTYDNGYSPSLVVLGPPPEGHEPATSAAGLIDSVLASGKKGGYAFTYTPGPSDSQSRVVTYAVSARPMKYAESGKRSFYTNETGVIRATGENRAATFHDPPIEQ